MNFTYSEAFGGIGAWGKAIDRVTKRHNDTSELIRYWEIDKYASNAFAAIHEVSEELNLCDITEKHDALSEVDVFFYSPPCQTFSIAGKREGTTVDKGNLFYAAVQHLEQTKPKYAIMENVKGLPTGDTKKDFNAMIWYLESIGYYNYWKVLNTKDYGIPQNRERVFIVSIRADLYDNGKRFEFPKPRKLKLKLVDLLENNVDEKYYISKEKSDAFVYDLVGENVIGTTAPEATIGQRDIVYRTDSYIGCLTATDYKGPKQIMVNQIGNISESDSFGGNPQTGRIYSVDGLSPTLSTMQGGGQEPKVLCLNTKNKDGKQPSYQDRVYSENGIMTALTCEFSNRMNILNNFQIRKLTPLECFRLQGFDDADYYKAVKAYDETYTKGASDSQMYKRAGNSITVNVIEEILENLLYDRKQEGQQLSLF